mgnify:CR=1 FL=1
MGNWPLTPIDGGAVNYSASPVKTGQKWIDGKDVYRIVVTGTVNGVTYLPIPETGMDTIVYFSVLTNGGNFLTSTFFGSSVGNLCVASIDRTHNRVTINNQIGEFNGAAVHVIIDYTKN